MTFIEALSIPEPNSGCWLWLKSCNAKGYPQHYFERSKPISAHRLSYTLYKGGIPTGLLVRHKCDTKCCVNPDHLVVGTHKQNTADMVGRRRQISGNKRLDDATIARMRADTHSRKQISAAFGVSYSYTCALLSGVKR